MGQSILAILTVAFVLFACAMLVTLVLPQFNPNTIFGCVAAAFVAACIAYAFTR